VRTQAKALSAGSTRAVGNGRSLLGLACLCALVLAAFLGSGAPSAGATAGDFPGHGFLPDNRAWEMVSPADKNGADVLVDTTQVRAAADGNAIQFASLQGFGDQHGNLITAEYMALRRPSGWNTHAITPLQEPLNRFDATFGFRPGYYGEFSPDLSKGLFLAKSPLTDAPNVAAARNLYLREDLRVPGAGSYRLISDATTPQSAGPVFNQPIPFDAAASADFRHVLFESTRNLTDDAVGAELSTSAPKLYEWVDGTVRLAGILPASEGGGPAPASQAGQGALGRFNTARTISTDGSRVIFTVPDNEGESCDPFCGSLYLRDDQGTESTADDTTTRIGVSERTNCAEAPDACTGTPAPDPAGPRAATYWRASADGAQVFFTSSEQLTDDDHNALPDLYRWDLEAPVGHRLTRISVDREPADGDAAEIIGVIGASEEGDYIYFIAGGQLVEGGPIGSVGGLGGINRIFVWHEGTIHEVGGINGGEMDELTGIQGWKTATTIARVTPNGSHLVFMSAGTSELTGYDQGSTCEFLGGTACSEVYVYDATANAGEGELVCASCNPGGQTATANATIVPRFAQGTAGLTSHLNRTITNDGRLVFFTSGEALLPGDTNHTDDAYEYNTTTRAVNLLSSGTSPDPSFFLEASSDGSDAFFATRERLSGWDVDESTDIYDARVDGGLTEPPLSSPTCDGETCQPPSAPIVEVTPASTVVFQSSQQCRKRDKHRHRRKHRHHRRSARCAHDHHGGNR